MTPEMQIAVAAALERTPPLRPELKHRIANALSVSRNNERPGHPRQEIHQVAQSRTNTLEVGPYE